MCHSRGTGTRQGRDEDFYLARAGAQKFVERIELRENSKCLFYGNLHVDKEISMEARSLLDGQCNLVVKGGVQMADGIQVIVRTTGTQLRRCLG